MIIAGPCSFVIPEQTQKIIDTARELKGTADMFRCKLWLGGTRPDKYMVGIETGGIPCINKINAEILPAGVEVQTPEHVSLVKHLPYIWVGARNSQNYGLLSYIRKSYTGEVFVKRNPSMTIDDVYGIYDIMKSIYGLEIYVIERGINTFDRSEISRWAVDLAGIIRIKNERKEVFEKIVIDCSHAAGIKNRIEDTYKAFKAIGCKNFMFECTVDGMSMTDKNHMISTDELKEILKND